MGGLSKTDRRLAIAIVIASLALVLLLGVGFALTTESYNQAYPRDRPEQIDPSTVSDRMPGPNETIADDETPMASGIGGESAPGVDGFAILLVAGIVVVVGFYSASTYRLNRNISKMRDNLK